MMSVVEAIIRTKSIHLVRESVHLSDLGISKFMAVVSSHLLRTEKPITLITFNMTFMWTFHTNSLLNGYVFYECT